MKKQLLKLIKEHGFALIEFEYENNFEWRYYKVIISRNDEYACEFDFEYNIHDADYKENNLREFEQWLMKEGGTKTKVKCPDCDKESESKEWKDSSVWCYECGDHNAYECPSCGRSFDHIWEEDTYDEIDKKQKIEINENART